MFTLKVEYASLSFFQVMLEFNFQPVILMAQTELESKPIHTPTFR